MNGDFLTGALRETLSVFGTVPPGTPMTTSEIQDQLEVGRRSTYERLDRLADGGYIETKAVGSRGRVWWVPATEQAVDESNSESSTDPSKEVPAGWSDADVGELIALHDEFQREVEPCQRILETIEDGVYVVDPSGRISLVNDAYCEMTGYSREELVGMDVRELVDEETMAVAQEYWEELFDGTREFARFEADVETADGSTFRGEGVFSLLEREDGRTERVGVVRDVTERDRQRRALEQSRARLSAINQLNLAFRDITHAVLEQSTRAEIERVVCDSLVASDAYGFAWIGDLDGESETLRVRTVAGADSTEPAQISIDPEDPDHCASAARAIVEDEIQLTEWTPSDLERLPWGDALADLDIRTSADVPIGHESTTYGVLSVYTHRENGFRAEEASLFGFLGEVIGHAIASVERKRALMSDELLELEFRVDDVFESLGADPVQGGLVFESMIPIGSGTYLTYGTASAELREPLQEFIEAIPYLESLDVLDDRGPKFRFEARMVDPPVLSAVSNRGGYIDLARFADGDLYLRVHVAMGTDARQIVGIVQENYPTARLVSQRQITRDQDSPARLSRALSEELTERQRIVLETAYAAGYFDSPRLNSGSEVADTLGISGPTFHEHLRKALHTFLGRFLLDHPGDEDQSALAPQSGEQSR